MTVPLLWELFFW